MLEYFLCVLIECSIIIEHAIIIEEHSTIIELVLGLQSALLVHVSYITFIIFSLRSSSFFYRLYMMRVDIVGQRIRCVIADDSSGALVNKPERCWKIDFFLQIRIFM